MFTVLGMFQERGAFTLIIQRWIREVGSDLLHISSPIAMTVLRKTDLDIWSRGLGLVLSESFKRWKLRIRGSSSLPSVFTHS